MAGRLFTSESVTEGHPDKAADRISDTVLDIGYASSANGFDGASGRVSVSLGAQSPDIAQGVDTASPRS